MTDGEACNKCIHLGQCATFERYKNKSCRVQDTFYCKHPDREDMHPETIPGYVVLTGNVWHKCPLSI